MSKLSGTHKIGDLSNSWENSSLSKRHWLAWNCFRYGVVLLPFLPLFTGISLGTAFILSWKKEYRTLGRYPLNWGLGLFSVWLILTSFFAWNSTEAWLGFLNFLPFIIYLSASGAFIQTISQLRQLAWLIVLPSLPIVLLGLSQLFWGWGSHPFINTLNLGWNLISYGEPQGRMSSIFMYANILAAYLVIVFILGLGLWLDTYFFWQPKYSKLPLTILSLTIIFDGIGLVLTDSRNAWILSILGCLCFALYLGYRWLVLGIIALASMIAGASWGPSTIRESLRSVVPAYFWARLSDELYPNRSLGSLRTTQWQFAWEMMLQHPLFGWGLRNFTPLYGAKMGEWLGHPHNFFLMLLAEIGIPGTILLCSLVGWVMLQGVKLLNLEKPSHKMSKKQASDNLILFTYLITFGSCVFFNLFDVTLFNIKLNILGWVLLSTIWGIVYHQFQIKGKIS